MAKEPLEFGEFYHIYNRGNNGETLFSQERNYSYFLTLYFRYIQPVAYTYAYCLMPNHFHFTIRTYTVAEQQTHWKRQNQDTSKRFTPIQPNRAFNNLFIAYARAYNHAMDRSGKLFTRSFQRKVVDNDAYLAALIRYIHRNPKHHGFVDDFRDWPWTSYGSLASDKVTYLKRDAVNELFDSVTEIETLASNRILEFEDFM